MSKPPISACIAWERAETRALLQEIAPAAGLALKDSFALCDEPPDLRGRRVLLLEQCDLSATVIARTQAFASVDPDMLVVLVVPEGISADLESAVRAAGAYDVLELGPRIERSLAGIVNTARRVMREEDARSRMSADLAHRERLSAIGVLAAGVGHEINNPAAVVLMSSEHVRSDLETLLSVPRYQQLDYLQRHVSRWIEDMGDCIAATRRISTIVKTLGHFSRKSEDARPAPVVLNDEVATVVRLVGKELRYQASFALDLDPELPHVIASAHSVTQVITNLVVNALQALEQSPESERSLTLRTSHDDSSVMLEVSDNGPGIAPDDLQRIFDPFFTTKDAGKGSGLGLAITRELVVKAGGEIFVESELGAGARFSVVFPRPLSRRTEPRVHTMPPPRQSRLRVMIVDDDEFVLRAIARSLADDFECIPLASANEAVDTLRADSRVDALLADIVMPGMNGYQLYEVVRAEHPHLAARTVFFSGGVRDAALQDAISQSGRPCLDKPIDVRELGRALRDVTA